MELIKLIFFLLALSVVLRIVGFLLKFVAQIINLFTTGHFLPPEEGKESRKEDEKGTDFVDWYLLSQGQTDKWFFRRLFK